MTSSTPNPLIKQHTDIYLQKINLDNQLDNQKKQILLDYLIKFKQIEDILYSKQIIKNLSKNDIELLFAKIKDELIDMQHLLVNTCLCMLSNDEIALIIEKIIVIYYSKLDKINDWIYYLRKCILNANRHKSTIKNLLLNDIWRLRRTETTDYLKMQYLWLETNEIIEISDNV